MPQILFLCEYPTLNGGERSMLATWGHLQEAGFSLSLMGPGVGPLADEARGRGVSVIPFGFCGDGPVRRPLDRLRDDLAAAMQRYRPDLLDANSLSMSRLAGPVAAELGLPSVGHLRDIIRLSARAISDLNYNTRLLAVSQATRCFHVAAGLAADKTHVLYNGVDLDRFRPRAKSGYLHAELGLPPEVALVGAIGQIGLRKGQDVLAGAATRLTASLSDVHYLMIGQRCSQKDESQQFEASLRAPPAALRGHVHLLGRREDIECLLNELTLLVHPAREEPLGRVLLEAAASGLSIVATDVGGTGEIFPPESRAARLVPPDQPEALAAAIRELMADPAECARLGAAARRRAEEAFGIQVAARGLAEHYRQVLVRAARACSVQPFVSSGRNKRNPATREWKPL